MSKEDLEQLWWENERKRLQTDLFYLCTEYLGYTDLNKSLHGPICDQLLKWEDVLVMLPRGHLKSSLITIGKTIQFVLKNQNIRIKIVNASYNKAAEFLAEIKQHLQDERLVHLFPEILYENPAGESDSWSANKINVRRTRIVAGATVEIMGIMTGNIGKHCEIIIFDDLHDDKNTKTAELIKVVKRRYRLYLSVLEPKGLRINIGTRWKKEDIYGDLVKGGVKCIRREDIENGKIIFPEKFDEALLKAIKLEQGSHFYYLQYKNRVLSDEDVQFKAEWFKWFSGIKNWVKIYILCDPAIATDDRACQTVIQTIGQRADGTLDVIKSHGFKGRVQEIVDNLFLEYLKYSNSFEVYVGVEKAGYQHALHQWIEKDQITYGVYFEVIELEPRGRNKDYRIKRLSPLFERGQINLNEEDCEEVYEQLSEYGGTTKVDHADCLGYLIDVLVEGSTYDVVRMGEPSGDPYSLENIIAEEMTPSCLDY